MDFTELGLSEAVLKGVEAAGYTEPTTIQAKAIPAIIAGRDVIGASQTGTGKTAAFVLPILSRLKEPGNIRCLILEPVRELAAQVEVAIQDYASGTGLKSVCIYGGVGYSKQTDAIKNGVDIVIATPGRLLDLMQRGELSLEHLEFLVLDEVDRMLDMGFLPDVRRIVDQCKKERQTLFFSATMPPAIETFAAWLLKDPLEVEVGQRIKAADTVSHAFYPVASSQREQLLQAILTETDFHSVMIFTRTKRDADSLARML
ncbi:MAG: ATP-dependent RNA helicase RhlE, partial [Verrucomicrobiales bacterium]